MPLVLSAAQMKAVDRAAIERWGVPGIALMENAGRGVAEVIARERPALLGLDVRVVCGPGQNGGDGFVIARHLANRGAHVTVLLTVPPAKIAGDAAVFARAMSAIPGLVVRDGSSDDVAAWRQHLTGADVLVDAIFGTGLRAEVTGAPAAAVEAMNGTDALRVAVDVPTGLDADSGAARGPVLRAHVTATMGAPKLGLVLDPEAPVGRIEVVDIGVSVAMLADDARVVGPLCHWLDGATIAPLLPTRAPAAHKGTFGHLLVVAGSPGKTGAALLSARAGLRAGAGLVTVASTRAGQAALDAKVMAEMTASYTAGVDDDAEAESFARLRGIRASAVAVGPGIPTGPGMRALVSRLAAELPLPLVIDADGLNLLGTEAPAVLRGAPGPRVLTPHPGEMGRLVALPSAEVQRDRLAVARRLAAETDAVVVLKGARTIVAAPDGTASINPAADPALATAGSGDVLTGVVGALLAQGVGPYDAARAAVFVHGEAAVLAAEALGARTIVATDLLDSVARAFERQRCILERDGDFGRA